MKEWKMEGSDANGSENLTSTTMATDSDGFFSTFEVLIQNIVRENNIKRSLIERKNMQAEAVEKEIVAKQKRLAAMQEEILRKNQQTHRFDQSVALRQANTERLREHVRLLEEHENSLKRQISLKQLESKHRSDTLGILMQKAANMNEEYKKKYQASTISELVTKFRKSDLHDKPLNQSSLISRLPLVNQLPLVQLDTNDGEEIVTDDRYSAHDEEGATQMPATPEVQMETLLTEPMEVTSETEQVSGKDFLEAPPEVNTLHDDCLLAPQELTDISKPHYEITDQQESHVSLEVKETHVSETNTSPAMQVSSHNKPVKIENQLLKAETERKTKQECEQRPNEHMSFCTEVKEEVKSEKKMDVSGLYDPLVAHPKKAAQFKKSVLEPVPEVIDLNMSICNINLSGDISAISSIQEVEPVDRHCVLSTELNNSTAVNRKETVPQIPNTSTPKPVQALFVEQHEAKRPTLSFTVPPVSEIDSQSHTVDKPEVVSNTSENPTNEFLRAAVVENCCGPASPRKSESKEPNRAKDLRESNIENIHAGDLFTDSHVTENKTILDESMQSSDGKYMRNFFGGDGEGKDDAKQGETSGFNFANFFGNSQQDQPNKEESSPKGFSFGGFWNDTQAGQDEDEPKNEGFNFGNIFDQKGDDGDKEGIGFCFGGGVDKESEDDRVSFCGGNADDDEGSTSQKDFFNIFSAKSGSKVQDEEPLF